MTASTPLHDPDLLEVLAIIASIRTTALSLLDHHDTLPTSAAEKPAALELQKQQAELLAHVASLRGLHRRAVLSVRGTRQVVAEGRGEVDRLSLQLQNLVYEQRHLRGEIAACEGYDHKYRSLPLVPVDEFLEMFPDKEELPEHDLMIARIEHEYAERLTLEERRRGLLKRKQGLIAENKRRKDDLANLDKDLEKFIEAADPIIKTFEKEY